LLAQFYEMTTLWLKPPREREVNISSGGSGNADNHDAEIHFSHMLNALGQRINRATATTALRFFRKAIRNHDEPEVVTIDKCWDIHKGQYQHPHGDGLSPAEQFYLLAV
jgi:hypothetical protein